MSKRPVSVTLDRDNLLWLRARMRTLRRRSLSDMLDSLVAEAREQYGQTSEGRRSVVGTVTLSPDDPDLARADEALRELFSRSLDGLDSRPRPAKRREASTATHARKARAPTSTNQRG